ATHHLFLDRGELTTILLHLAADEFRAEAVETGATDKSGRVPARQMCGDQRGYVVAHQTSWQHSMGGVTVATNLARMGRAAPCAVGAAASWGGGLRVRLLVAHSYPLMV